MYSEKSLLSVKRKEINIGIQKSFPTVYRKTETVKSKFTVFCI